MQDKESMQESGIPKAPFVDNVEEFLKDEESADVVLRRMQSNYSAYKMLEMKLTQSKASLKNKLPDIVKALEMVQYLTANKEKSEGIDTHFELSEGVFAKANIKNTDVVCLWLGANVMVEYSFEEAKELLQKNLNSCRQSIERSENDLQFLKDQITTTEVNIARIYNYDVKQRRLQKATTAST